MPNVLNISSPIGWWSLTTDENQVLSADYQGKTLADAKTEPETRLEQRLHCMFSRYFRGEAVDFQTVPVLIPERPAMRFKVLQALRAIPRGQVQSYQWMAERIGNPNACRAVGGALGRNPVPIIIPCHRVVAKHYKLGGFMQGHADGPDIKTFLLGLEGYQVSGGVLVSSKSNSVLLGWEEVLSP